MNVSPVRQQSIRTTLLSIQFFVALFLTVRDNQMVSHGIVRWCGVLYADCAVQLMALTGIGGLAAVGGE